jgi:hypothetical protein
MYTYDGEETNPYHSSEEEEEEEEESPYTDTEIVNFIYRRYEETFSQEAANNYDILDWLLDRLADPLQEQAPPPEISDNPPYQNQHPGDPEPESQ